jgi:hypothetical protein
MIIFSFLYSGVSILDTKGWIKIGYPVSGVVFKLLLKPIISSYAAGIFFSATFSIKNGVSNWAKFPNSVYPKSRLYCIILTFNDSYGWWLSIQTNQPFFSPLFYFSLEAIYSFVYLINVVFKYIFVSLESISILLIIEAM